MTCIRYVSSFLHVFLATSHRHVSRILQSYRHLAAGVVVDSAPTSVMYAIYAIMTFTCFEDVVHLLVSDTTSYDT